MSNAAQLQEQAIQYVSNVREGHQSLIRKYLKDYRVILDETEMNVKDLNNVKARKADLITASRLKQFFGDIKQRYVTRTDALNAQFLQDVNDSCKNAERQIESVFPNSGNAPAKSPFALMDFTSEPEAVNFPQLTVVRNALDTKDKEIESLAKKCSRVHYAHIGVWVLALIIDFSIVALALESVKGFLTLILSVFVVPGIVLLLLFGGKKITTNLYTSYAQAFTNFFTTNKEILVSQYQETLKYCVKETEKKYMVKFQKIIENGTALLEEAL
jgi:hypothetical protein